MGKFIDLTGKVFDRWKVVKLSHKEPKTNSNRGNWIYWECVCTCGRVQLVKGMDLRRGHSKSCGCLFKDKPNGEVHGKVRTPEYKLYHSAKRRAKIKGLDFDIDLDDVIIPEYCPILTYLKLETCITTVCDHSPSLDRIDPTKGYVKGNVHVISYKANTMKNDGTFKDIKLLYEWMCKQ